jgi:hypothetical protein
VSTDAAGPFRGAAHPRPDTAAAPGSAAPGSGAPGSGGTPPDTAETSRRAWLDLACWCALVAVGLAFTAIAVEGGAKLGTASAPFLGAYRIQLTPLSLLAPTVAVLVVVVGVTGLLDRLRWRVAVTLSYLGALAWAFALALADGTSGLTRSLRSQINYAPDITALNNHPLHYLATYTADVESHTFAARGHPPGSVLLLWGFEHVGVTDTVTLGVLITALGVLTVPLVLYSVRDVCGETTARRYIPILVLAPYAIWVAVSMDGIVAALGALAVAAGVYASGRRRRGRTAAAWSVLCGVLIGLAGMFAYSVVWLGLAIVLLYFARRRPFLNIGTGLGALVPVTIANLLGFSWLAGLTAAGYDFQTRIEPHRSALWWSGISLVALIVACGPALYASARKIRNTPAWPFLLGAGIAVLFTLVTAQARGGAEAAWLPFFPWLTVAAVAPARPAGPVPAVPWPLVAGGAITAVVVQAVLATPW